MRYLPQSCTRRVKLAAVLIVFTFLFLYYSLRLHNLNHFFNRHHLVFKALPTQLVWNHSSPHSHSLIVFVFVHIQKTGGTLIERNLVNIGLFRRPCQCVPYLRRCSCKTDHGDTWLVSRFSTGWMCGVHADVTEYTECVNKSLNTFDGHYISRKFEYFTLLRDPVDRYLSEWLHVRRGATWRTAKLSCRNTSAYSQSYRPCYTISKYAGNTSLSQRHKKNPTWTNVSLQTFLDCPFNLAINRQVRMLANLSRLGCYRNLLSWNTPRSDYVDLSVTQRSLLLSAQDTLSSFLRVYGLNAYLPYTQYLFQRVLHIVFNRWLADQHVNSLNKSHAQRIRPHLSTLDVQQVRDSNRLDMLLYKYAVRLFVLRLTVYTVHDTWIPARFKRPLLTLWRNRNHAGLQALLLYQNPSFSAPFIACLKQIHKRSLSQPRLNTRSNQAVGLMEGNTSTEDFGMFG
ncbi:heparan sulfate 6-O-sulfotransferase HS6ST1 [Paragonimus westermani]|uniref:Heparan-sulfate 6-O-sulfotransferase n=1 Tax=Paragonimus westermani TaxID=34504 RepID=A0A5J4N521_9TREM|nr:heparan sulfate 6-O-sulfotransferase HS6ST1 [Paragonimus westermani]